MAQRGIEDKFKIIFLVYYLFIKYSTRPPVLLSVINSISRCGWQSYSQSSLESWAEQVQMLPLLFSLCYDSDTLK